jgi:hypothetical protein
VDYHPQSEIGVWSAVIGAWNLLSIYLASPPELPVTFALIVENGDNVI